MDRRVLGAPLQLLHERVVAGRLGEPGQEDAVREIRRQLGAPGRLEATGRELVWTNPNGRNLRVSIAPRGDANVIRVQERLGELGGGLFLGMALPMTFAGLGFILPICIAVLEAPVLIPLAFALWAGLSFLLARTIFKTIARQRDHKIPIGHVDAQARELRAVVHGTGGARRSLRRCSLNRHCLSVSSSIVMAI